MEVAAVVAAVKEEDATVEGSKAVGSKAGVARAMGG